MHIALNQRYVKLRQLDTYANVHQAILDSQSLLAASRLVNVQMATEIVRIALDAQTAAVWINVMNYADQTCNVQSKTVKQFVRAQVNLNSCLDLPKTVCKTKKKSAKYIFSLKKSCIFLFRLHS